jgi:DNA-directed RNA polymerase beta' subunit
MVGIIAAQSIGEPTSQLSIVSSSKIKVIIKNKKDNTIKLYSNEIGKLCDNIINENIEYTYDTGHKNSVETELNNLENEYYIIGVNSIEQTSWNKISHVSRHPVNGQIMKVTTKSGRNVESTLSHSHLVRRNQTVEPILGSDLKIGMRIPVAKKIDNTFIKNEIDINGKLYKLDYLFGWFIGAYLATGNITKFTKIFNISINEELSINEINKVPDYAFLAPNEFKAGFLQGYFDNECDFNNIRIESTNEQLIKDIALLLNYFDIFGNIKYDDKLVILSISSQYALTYRNNIGTYLHKTKLDNICNNSLPDDVDKINGLDEIIKVCNKTLDLNSLEKDISRITLKEYIKVFKTYSDSKEIEILEQAANSNVIWDEIVDIEIYTPDQNDYVYDFTVPDNQTFMIDNGIIVHNTLNTKHSAGVASKSGTTGGVPRIEELLHYSKDIKTPQMIIYFNNDIANIKQKCNKITSYLKFLTIKELIDSAQIYYDSGLNDNISIQIKNDNVQNPFFINNQKVNISLLPFVFRLKLNMEKLHDKETTLLDIKTKFISYWQKNFNNLKNLKKNEKDIFTKITKCCILSNNDKHNQIIHIRFNISSFNYNMLTEFLKILLEQIILKGINNIKNVSLEKSKRLITDLDTGDYKLNDEFVVFTEGINLEKLKYIKGINMARTTCNDIQTIYRLYGIEAARQILLNEFMNTFKGSNINHNHMSVLIDMMTHTGNIISIDRHGLGKLDSDVFTKASFEKTMDHFINAAIFNEIDTTNSVSSRILLGKVIPGGTGAFELLLDSDKIENSEYTNNETGGRPTFAGLEEDALFKDVIKYGFSKNDIFVPN